MLCTSKTYDGLNIIDTQKMCLSSHELIILYSSFESSKEQSPKKLFQSKLKIYIQIEISNNKPSYKKVTSSNFLKQSPFKTDPTERYSGTSPTDWDGEETDTGAAGDEVTTISSPSLPWTNVAVLCQASSILQSERPLGSKKQNKNNRFNLMNVKTAHKYKKTHTKNLYISIIQMLMAK